MRIPLSKTQEIEVTQRNRHTIADSSINQSTNKTSKNSSMTARWVVLPFNIRLGTLTCRTFRAVTPADARALEKES
jgi:hypothetical protein